MTDINETIAEVLRLDELSEDLSPAPWHVSGLDSQDVRDDEGEATADAYCSNDAALIAYYRTAAPALAREVQRLQAEVERLHLEHAEERLVSCCEGHNLGYDAGHRAGQEAMRERAAALCRERQEKHRRGRIRCGPGKKFGKLQVAEDEAFSCVSAIRTLEVER